MPKSPFSQTIFGRRKQPILLRFSLFAMAVWWMAYIGPRELERRQYLSLVQRLWSECSYRYKVARLPSALLTKPKEGQASLWDIEETKRTQRRGIEPRLLLGLQLVVRAICTINVRMVNKSGLLYNATPAADSSCLESDS